MPDIPADLQERFAAALTDAKWAQARARAYAWAPAAEAAPE